ncbi:hypothetical protein HK100_012417 [Physocladia obscura]|uniref:C-CAP/cofactor C-like domain-containing protein n=1 Tax=Physocladia obscura TaxID=109957 RepID=A0AAD5TAW8_9FUNG|nr:hypothetical protein HK100_012417 [Physocladia obscura]
MKANRLDKQITVVSVAPTVPEITAETNETETETEIPPPNSALYFKNLKNCSVHVTGPSTKIFVEDCANTQFVFAARIVTQIIEVWRSESVVCNIATTARTVQVDGSADLQIVFRDRLFFETIVWTKCERVSVAIPDDGASEVESNSATTTTAATGAAADAAISEAITATTVKPTIDSVEFGLSKAIAEYPSLNINDMDQFIVRLINGAIRSELIVRVGPLATTTREDRAYVDRTNRNLQVLLAIKKRK